MSPIKMTSQDGIPKEPSSSSSSTSKDAVKIADLNEILKEPSSSSSSTSKDPVKITESFSAGNSNKKFQDVDIEQILVVEVFAGTGRLTSALRDKGFRTMAIGRDKTRSKQVHIVQYDLEDPFQLEALIQLLDKERQRILWVHFAPSCGTASRSRERPLKHLERMGYEIPKPLRNDQYPMGIPGLSGKDLAKVTSANATYAAMLRVCQFCWAANIAISIENPGNSLFWKIPSVERFLREVGGYDAVFHHCVHGGFRDKLTRWWASVDWFLPLAILCDKQHAHAPWNPEIKDGKIVYPTHEEAAYPILLCRRLADIAFEQAMLQGAIQHDTLQQQIESSETTAHRFLINMLLRGKKFKPLVSEYGSYVLVAVSGQNSRLETADILKHFPKGAKIVHRRFFKGSLRVDEKDRKDKPFESQQADQDGRHRDGVLAVSRCLEEKVSGDAWEILSIGVPRDEKAFLDKALAAGHPRSMAIHLSDGVKEVLHSNFKGEPYTLIKKRLAYISKWSNRAKELVEQEKQVHDGLPEHLKGILGGKRLLLMGEMLQDAGYPDQKLVSDICSGFNISGWLQQSNVFPKETKRPDMI